MYKIVNTINRVGGYIVHVLNTILGAITIDELYKVSGNLRKTNGQIFASLADVFRQF